MSKHNYSQYSNKRRDVNSGATAADAAKNNAVKPIKPNPETTIAKHQVPEVKLVEETVETVKLPENVKGVVANCAKLNVRAEPTLDGDIVSVLDVMSEIEINLSESTDEWFKICTTVGVEGYCMRKFVDAHL